MKYRLVNQGRQVGTYLLGPEFHELAPGMSVDLDKIPSSLTSHLRLVSLKETSSEASSSHELKVVEQPVNDLGGYLDES
jgi:hypothetical protein